MSQESFTHIFLGRSKLAFKPKFSNFFFSKLPRSDEIKYAMYVYPLTGMRADGLDEEHKQTPTQESVTVWVSHTHVTLTKRPNSERN